MLIQAYLYKHVALNIRMTRPLRPPPEAATTYVFGSVDAHNFKRSPDEAPPRLSAARHEELELHKYGHMTTGPRLF